MRSLTETLRDLKDMIVTSISYEPCSEEELNKRDFLKNTSTWGVTHCVHDLLREKRLFEKIKDGAEILCAYDSPLDKEDLYQGHLYRSKRRTSIYSNGEIVYNDLRIICLDDYSIQYDSPSIGVGKDRPVITINDFLNRVKADVTDETTFQWVVVQK